MKRREFSKAALAVVTLGTQAVNATEGTRMGAGSTAVVGVPVAASSVPDLRAAVGKQMLGGTNLSGMEWAQPGLRHGLSSAPNVHFTVPRAADVTYLAASGFSKNRLPIQWELLQPMLHDTHANAAAIAAIGRPGAFHTVYESYITGVLDAHAAVGTKCIIDNHNYCRYQDFKFQSDGSVIGLVVPKGPLLRPYTTDKTQIRMRIFALAEGTTLTRANFNDFWIRVANKWRNHPGFGGYGLMNEPHDLPVSGATTGVYDAPPYKGEEDLTIWPAYAQAAINAIRAIDAVNPIYVAGNVWDSAMAIATKNPGFPLTGKNLIYEVHMYLDALSNGAAFDYDIERAKNFRAGIGSGPITASTGLERIKMATNWAKANGVKLALTEVGMPIDDPRWAVMFKSTIEHAVSNGCEIYSWMGGNHWPIHNYAINHVPGWHQNKTLEPLVSSQLKAAAGVVKASFFDDGPGYALAGTPVTITVYARGNLASPVKLTVTSNKGGSLSKTVLILAAGANGQDTFTYLPPPDVVATLTYASDHQQSGRLPPPRKIFSLNDPVTYAATSLQDAALAILAKYNASKWDLADGYTDYLQGAPAAAGNSVRAISDSGYGSRSGNAMEMLNWVNKANGGMGAMSVPVMRVTNGKKNSDHSVYNTWGFWCKKSTPMPGIQPNPKNKMAYNLEDAHFAIAVASVPGQRNTGVLFQASQAEARFTSELNFTNSCPGAKWVDAKGQMVQLVSSTRLPVNMAAVVSFSSVPGMQKLRVNSDEVARATASFAPSVFNQMLIGWGFNDYYPRDGFMGNIYAVITGKGAIDTEELDVLEKYLATIAGLSL